MLSPSEGQSVNLFTRMDEAEIKSISEAMGRLKSMPAAEVERVLDEFAARAPADGLGLPPGRAGTIAFAEPRQLDAWTRIGRVDERRLAKYLSREHPQTTAIVLLKLGAAAAARIMLHFPAELAADVAHRMGKIGKVSATALASIERALVAEFLFEGAARVEVGSSPEADRLAAAFAPPAGRVAPPAAGAAAYGRARQSAFESLSEMSDVDLRALLRSVDTRDLVVALKGASEDLRERCQEVLPPKAGERIAAALDALGAVRLKDIDAAQARIMAAARAGREAAIAAALTDAGAAGGHPSYAGG